MRQNTPGRVDDHVAKLGNVYLLLLGQRLRLGIALGFVDAKHFVDGVLSRLGRFSLLDSRVATDGVHVCGCGRDGREAKGRS